MDNPRASILFLLGLLLHATILILPCSARAAAAAAGEESQLQTYIISVKHPEDGNLVHVPEVMHGWYTSLLQASAALSTAAGAPQQRIVHSYSHAMTGFAARLTKKELADLSKMDWFVTSYPDRKYKPHTTHTPEFLGLNQQSGLWKRSNEGEGIIIGMIDTGVTPGHPSFNDEGMPPPPSRWKGKCEPPVVCNNKLIGASSYILGETPVDGAGHGTHTSSTAAGAFVQNASVLGSAAGRASGMAPRAHLAMYKVCSEFCQDSDILAGIGGAIRDGCDVISLSLGAVLWSPFDDDPVAVGTFSAVRRGIFVSTSAGNSGPSPNTISNEAPWEITVAASTMDRAIVATVRLGNGVELDGESLYQPKDFVPQMFPLVYAGSGRNPDASYCGAGAFDGFDVRGKIVLCYRGGGTSNIDKGRFVKLAGGAAMIVMNQQVDGHSILTDQHVLPASNIGNSDGMTIMDYINSKHKPRATIIFKGTVTGTPRAPVVSSFSSRGPNTASPGILKPDITGPGVNVLAAWPPQIGPESTNQTGPSFNVISGTSMSCPHISGVAALVKKVHPDWSPAAIKSAIMTTAYNLDNKGDPIRDEKFLPAGPFAVGAGHVDGSRAADPGLIYDTNPDDYIPYLCGLGFSSPRVSTIANRTVDCSSVKNITEAELNYPSLTVNLGPHAANLTVWRTVTNVGEANSTYRAEVDAPTGVSVVVKPDTLRFMKLNEKKGFSVSFASPGASVDYLHGQMKWVSPNHIVQSPIIIVLNVTITQ